MKQATLKLTAIGMLLAGVISTSTSKAQNSSINVVTSAVPFLRINPDARGGGMGDVGIATLGDANSLFWNHAKYPFMECGSGVAVSYTPWLNDLGLNDVYMASLAGYYKLGNNQALTLGMRYFSLGNIQFTDALGNELNKFRPREFSIDLGYSRKLSNKLGLGIALRYISSDLAGGTQYNGITYKKGSSVAGDLHLYHHANRLYGQGFAYGVTLSNLGSKISYTEDATQKEYIPANLGIGLAYTKAWEAEHKLTFAADFNKLLVPTPPVQQAGQSDADFQKDIFDYRDQSVVGSWFSSLGDAPDGAAEEFREVTAALGAEYWYRNVFAFRAGYFYEHEDKGGRQYFTLGAGLRYNIVGLNFSYLLPSGSGVTRNPLSNTLRFTLNFNFGCATKAATTVATPAPAPVAVAPAAAVAAPAVVAAAPARPAGPMDTDGDGIMDSEDSCPELKGDASNHGCPVLTLYYKRAVPELDEFDRSELDRVVTYLNRHPELKVTLNGHASALGSDADNMVLSQTRVNNARDYLMSKGISSDRLKAVAYGETQTIGNQDTEEGRAASRRLEVRVSK